ncbi:hypothetical protein BN1723_017056 [Verticillium longisporum]|uniref:Large ribosomal subunit protein uL10 n=1 Tax=Verticillium longisporum TaxID=100787 RepID=A0A0G4KGD7_VERLO|nr:hypothetical protein BN1723_017056 [Verticillium longisporum]
MAAEDLFAQFFGGGGGGLGGMFGGGMQNRGPPKARTIHHTHKVSLEDIYRGKISKLALQRSIICPKCEGRGGKEGAVKRCAGCDGHGMKTMMRQMGPMIQRFQTVCPDCSGEGETINTKDRCKHCSGKKTVVDRKVLHVHVDRGVRSGKKVEFRGEGDQAPGIQAGDVVFEIEQKPHARFTRKEDDLLYKAEIELVTALAGGTIFVEHLDDRWLSIDILPGEAICPDAVKMVRGQGMPSERHHDHGNMYIQFSVKFPEKNWMQDEASFEALRKLLPAPSLQTVPPPDGMTEPADLEDIETQSQARQMHQVRHSLRGDAVVLMGKNTMVRRALKTFIADSPEYERLLPHVKGNVGFVFTNGGLKDIRDKVLANKVAAPARAGAVAPSDVWIPAGNTGMEPGKTSFFQALGVPTKIARGTIEITSDLKLVEANSKVGASEASLLNLLNISPFTYGLGIAQVYDQGQTFPADVLDIGEEQLLKTFAGAITAVAAISLAINFPTLPSVIHSLVNSYKKVLAVAIETEISWPEIDPVARYLTQDVTRDSYRRLGQPSKPRNLERMTLPVHPLP